MKRFETHREEHFKTRVKRFMFNVWPTYRRSGGRIAFISDDYQEIHVDLKLKFTTRNYVGSVFGGSIYSALDPIYMAQLLNILGKDYVVWDKKAEIRFKRPIKTRVSALFVISDELLVEVKERVEKEGEMEFDLPAHWEDVAGKVYAEASKTIYVASKTFYQQKVAKRKQG
jgi:acyl-coenzyme A thioesterase PaaI-like protein